MKDHVGIGDLVKCDASRVNREFIFIIDDASEKDAGKYECEASNFVGTVSYTVEVAIKGKETRKMKNCFST